MTNIFKKTIKDYFRKKCAFIDEYRKIGETNRNDIPIIWGNKKS